MVALEKLEIVTSAPLLVIIFGLSAALLLLPVDKLRSLIVKAEGIEAQAEMSPTREQGT